MSRSKKNAPILMGLEITDVAAEGKAIGRYEERVVFVQHAVPGDVVDVQVTKKRNNYFEGFPIRYQKYSPIRVEPVCSHFGVCGGCKWQHLPYEQQLIYKQKEVTNNLMRIGKVQLPEVMPILGSAKNTYYRNKLEFTFSNKRWLSLDELKSVETFSDRDGLGFHVPGMFDKVVDVDTCYLQADPSNGIRRFIKAYALEHGLSFFDLRNQVGFLRTLIIRTSSNGEVMVIVVFYHEDKDAREALLTAVSQQFPQITSLMYVINEKANDTITDQEICRFAGKDHMIEEMEGLKFKIGPKSFYQTNSHQAYELYKVTRDFAALTGNELVYDLYTGTGTIANFVAHQARKVVGIEYVPEAIEDAKVNSAINGITNTLFFAGDMKDVLSHDFVETHGHPDVMIVDPPRAGMHEDVTNTILTVAPDRIVYVSCNSATQARDLNLLDVRYRVEKVQPVDMFPHTHHVENVVLLIRK
ncbi:23S rRNA (uracil(1939)-C(5))-methyltransferase RlmD [Breznakibacter xylanolyticus]|uniref:23S rRNA (uracil(1939)-C(5))-methyltransferase RlmD n=1 Tax=Breznakibacter xylanolyticus TaxID=990 RepID=UPI000DAD4DA8|nr:23S rRNA (uracil(1939)-C(5))-methyltransferase RlmD [Breznakibacter xylanolyticus]